MLKASLRASWAHEFHPERVNTASFEAAPGISFDQHGAPGITDAARLDGRLTVGIGKVEFQARAGSLIAPRSSGFDAEVGVRVRF